MDIRTTSAADLAALTALHDAAFGTLFEGKLVAELMAADLAALSLVALEDGNIVGHILFSPMIVEIDGETVLALALAPLAVHPDHQRRGIGSALTKVGLARARKAGWEAVIVLGHPEFYARFGFRADLAQGFDAPFSGPAFMALELTNASLSGRKGRIIYPAPFGIPASGDAPATV
ncbi:MAG: N-acetyltransferase [Rhodospirillaceae bacterium]|nr:N-acetyltransferase [Rhodospirillaceae bacterium]